MPIRASGKLEIRRTAACRCGCPRWSRRGCWCRPSGSGSAWGSGWRRARRSGNGRRRRGRRRCPVASLRNPSSRNCAGRWWIGRIVKLPLMSSLITLGNWQLHPRKRNGLGNYQLVFLSRFGLLSRLGSTGKRTAIRITRVFWWKSCAAFFGLSSSHYLIYFILFFFLQW